MDMTSDSGLASQDTDYPREIQEVLDELHQIQQTPRLVTSPEGLEALERKIRQGTDRLGSCLLPMSARESRFSMAYSHPYESNPMTWRLP